MTQHTAFALIALSFYIFGSSYSLATDGSESRMLAEDADPGIHSLVDVKGTVETFIRSKHDTNSGMNVNVKELDRRLRLARCEEELLANWSPGSRTLGRVTVQVQCHHPKPWRVHIQASVTMEKTVWALVRGVRRGDVLERELLTEKSVTLGASNTFSASHGTPVIDLEPWLGFVFSRRANAGQVIQERMLKPPKFVSKGEAVVIRHQSSGLQLQTRGTALRDAGAREQIKVRNSSSGKIIDVVVVAPGIVDILD